MVKEDNCMEPLVSVIVPVYNVLPYLREALDSVINQTYKNLEILVVDDGSTDGSGEVCDEYLSDPRVIVIHQENKGLSGARNTGLDRMTGEYVAFLDSDDAFMPEMIEKMLDAIMRNDTDASICGYDACYTNKSIYLSYFRRTRDIHFCEEKVLSYKEVLNLLIVDKICWAVWNKVFKRYIWNNIRFPEGDNFEDMRIMCQIIEQCRQITIVPDVRVFYRKRAGSITNLQTEKSMRDYMLAVHTIEDFIQKHISIVFSKESEHCFQEIYARILSIRYSELLLCPHSKETMSKIRREILIRWIYLEGASCHFKSRITYFLFLRAPVLLLPVRFCWRLGKLVLEKTHI